MKKLNRLRILLILKFLKIFIHLFMTKPLNAAYSNITIGFSSTTSTSTNYIAEWDLINEIITAKTFSIGTGHSQQVNALKLINDTHLASGSNDYYVKIWLISTATCIRTINTYCMVKSFALLKNGYLAVGLDWNNHNIYIYDINNGNTIRILDAHNRAVNTIDVFSHGDLASGSTDGYVRILDSANTYSIKYSYDFVNPVSCLRILTSGNIVVGLLKNTLNLHIWVPGSASLLYTVTAHSGNVISLELLSNGYIATCSDDSSAFIKIWSQSLSAIKTLTGQTATTRALKLLPSGLLASGSDDYKLKIWNTTTGALVKSLTYSQQISILAIEYTSSTDNLASNELTTTETTTTQTTLSTTGSQSSSASSTIAIISTIISSSTAISSTITSDSITTSATTLIETTTSTITLSSALTSETTSSTDSILVIPSTTSGLETSSITDNFGIFTLPSTILDVTSPSFESSTVTLSIIPATTTYIETSTTTTPISIFDQSTLPTTSSPTFTVTSTISSTSESSFFISSTTSALTSETTSTTDSILVVPSTTSGLETSSITDNFSIFNLPPTTLDFTSSSSSLESSTVTPILTNTIINSFTTTSTPLTATSTETSLFSSSTANISTSTLSSTMANIMLYQNITFNFEQLSSSQIIELLNSSYDLNNCLSNCTNNGICKFDLIKKKFYCACLAAYLAGKACQTDLRPCSSSPCLNNATCVDFTNAYKYNISNTSSYYCLCDQFYTGAYCETKIDICQNETCSFNGNCLDQRNKAKCKCFNMYLGEKCETESNELKVVKAIIKTASIIAIITVIVFYCIIMLMDISEYFMRSKRRPKKKSKHKKRHVKRKWKRKFKKFRKFKRRF